MIDENGYRANVGIIITNYKGELFWARRIGQYSWQFPQGGVAEGETTEETLFRELQEEIGLKKEHVVIKACTKSWLYYKLPKKLIRTECLPLCIGQKQKWYLLELVADENEVDLNFSNKPEFDDWKWVSYWYPMRHIVAFKREVYRRALCELSPNKSKWNLDSLDAGN